MSQNYYVEDYKKIYMLQDKILVLVEDSDFYLTGGTALSRFYLNHRYSDDIELFIHQREDYRVQVKKIYTRIREHFLIKPSTISDSYTQFFVEENDVIVKVELVLDVPFHKGGYNPFPQFSRVDNLMNILSNKVCALNRQAAKDVADIVFICEHLNFDWKEIIEDAMRKEVLEELTVVDLLLSFPISELDTVKWINRPDQKIFIEKVKRIAKDIVQKKTNSLV